MCVWKDSETSCSSLLPPEDAHFLLDPCHKPTALYNAMEKRIIATLKEMENRFGTVRFTGVLIESMDSFEVLSQLPELSSTEDVAMAWSSESVKDRVNVVTRLLSSVTQPH